MYGTTDGSSISISTIEKDIREMKEEYDAPIAYHTGERGYYFTDPDYSTDAIPFTPDDTEALRFAAMTLNQYKHVPIFGQFQNAISKIFDRVMISDRIDDEAIGRLVQFETLPAVPGSKWLNGLFNAVKEKLQVRIYYHSYNSETTKEYLINPYLLKEYKNRWYVIAYRPDQDKMGTFELGRIQQVKLLPTGFEMLPSFNPDDFFKYAFGITVLNGKPEKVSLLFQNSELRYLIDTPLHPSQKLTNQGAETSTIELEVYITTELVMNILSFGKKVKVIGPEQLRVQVDDAK